MVIVDCYCRCYRSSPAILFQTLNTFISISKIIFPSNSIWSIDWHSTMHISRSQPQGKLRFNDKSLLISAVSMKTTQVHCILRCFYVRSEMMNQCCCRIADWCRKQFKIEAYQSLLLFYLIESSFVGTNER